MRSLLTLPARLARRGLLGGLAAALVLSTTACDWITGIPTVTRVTVSLASPVISAGTTTQATGTMYGTGGRILNTTKVLIGYESSNPQVATVTSASGIVTGVSEGTAIITAKARDKSDTVTITVTPTQPASVVIALTSVPVGETVPLAIQVIDQRGQTLTGRKAKITSSNPAVVTVNNPGTTADVSVTGLQIGSSVLTVDVDGRAATTTINVLAPRVTRATLGLSKGTNTLLETETNQVVISLFDINNKPLTSAGQQITYQSDDATIATVNPTTGVVQGVRAGTTTIRANIAGSTFVPTFLLTVLPVPAKQVQIANRGQFLRLASDGTGVPSTRTAVALDSTGRQLVGRTITYTSSDNSVFTVNAVGIVTPRKIGTATLTASADNGTVTDAIALRVTEVPIVAAQVNPPQSTVFPGAKIQFSVVLTDSLGTQVTSNNVTWLTSTPQVLSIDSKGLGNAVAAGNVQVTVQVPQVNGLPTLAQASAAIVTVLPDPVVSINVQPTSVSLRAPGTGVPTSSTTTAVAVTLLNAQGTELNNRPVIVRVADPSIVSAVLTNSGVQLNISAIKTGSTTITLQALDASGNPQGAPATVTVTVQ